MDVNRADYGLIVRIPGIGLKSAKKIEAARKFSHIGAENLKSMGVSMNRAKYFLQFGAQPFSPKYDLQSEVLKAKIVGESTSKWKVGQRATQLSLFAA